MEPGSKNLSVAIGFNGKTTNALSLKCMMEFDDIVKTFGSKTLSMIESKPLEINYLLGREWELPEINKSKTKYPTSSSIYQNKDGSASITVGNYKTINIYVTHQTRGSVDYPSTRRNTRECRVTRHFSRKSGKVSFVQGALPKYKTCIYLSRTVQYINISNISNHMSNTATWAHKRYS